MKYFQDILSSFNFRLVEPQGNLTSEEECKDLAPEEFNQFLTEIPVKSVKMTIPETQKGNNIGDKLVSVYILKQKSRNLTDYFSVYQKKIKYSTMEIGHFFSILRVHFLVKIMFCSCFVCFLFSVIYICVFFFTSTGHMATNFIIQQSIEKGGIFFQKRKWPPFAPWQRGQSHPGHELSL